MTPAPLFDRRDFRIPDGIAHVCAAGETAFLRSHDAALLRYAADKSNGAPGRHALPSTGAVPSAPGGGQRPSLGDYLAGTGARSGASGAGGW